MMTEYFVGWWPPPPPPAGELPLPPQEVIDSANSTTITPSIPRWRPDPLAVPQTTTIPGNASHIARRMELCLPGLCRRAVVGVEILMTTAAELLPVMLIGVEGLKTHCAPAGSPLEQDRGTAPEKDELVGAGVTVN